MNAGLVIGSIIAVLSVAVTITFYAYSENKVATDRKAIQDDTLARAEEMIANLAKTVVYQTEKKGDSGRDKLLAAFNYLIATLDLVHLPHSSAAYIKDEIKKSVTTMKQAKNFVDSMQTPTKEDDVARQLESKTTVGELKEAKK